MTTLWECIVKTSAVTLAAWIFSLLLRRRPAALRHSLWLCALAAFVLIPALLPLAHRTPAMHIPAALDKVLDTAAPFPTAIPQPTKRPNASQPVSTSRILLTLWLAGFLVLCIRRTRAAFRMKSIAGRSTPSPGEPDVHLSAEIHTPLTWGLFRPVILLPASAASWTPDCLRGILVHEREHIRRFDSLSHWLCELVCAAWWFHPLVWLARSRAAHERECACDDAVIRSGARPSDYATVLLNLLSTLPSKGEPLMALSVLSNFERRIGKILRPDIDRHPSSATTRAAIAVAAFALIVPLAILHAQDPAGYADLSGTVVDSSGARIPNALVTASGSGGNREVTRADLSGAWTLSGIPAGKYTVGVQAPGFAVTARTLTLAPGQHATVDEALQLGAIHETIRVVGTGQARRSVPQGDSSPERIRVGGNVQPANLMRQVKPAYPISARDQGIEGTVLLDAVIGTNGDVLSLVVVNKLADPDLAAAALRAVQQWHYQPTLLNGVPVEVVTTIAMNFTLQE